MSTNLVTLLIVPKQKMHIFLIPRQDCCYVSKAAAMWKVPEEQEWAKLPRWLWAVTGMAGEKEGESVWTLFLASKMLQNNANSQCSMIQIWKKLSLQKQ